MLTDKNQCRSKVRQVPVVLRKGGSKIQLIMAASVERNLRLKVSIHSNGINQTVPRQLWYSVSQSPNSHITDVKKDLLTKLGTGLNLKALLSMEGFVIPDWETTQIFRDGDHIM